MQSIKKSLFDYKRVFALFGAIARKGLKIWPNTFYL